MFAFPNFVNGGREKVLSNHVAISGILTHEGIRYSVELTRSHKVPDPSAFVAASIMRGATVIWRYSYGAELLAKLAMAGDVPVLAFVERGRDRRLINVLPFTDIRVRSVLERADIKIAAAGYLKTVPVLTDEESHAIAERDAAIKQQQAQERVLEKEQRRRDSAAIIATVLETETQRKIRKAENRRRRDKLRASLMDRTKIRALGSNGQTYVGLPLEADEDWTVLPPGTVVVIVERYLAGATLRPMSAFRVHRRGDAAPTKEAATPIVLTQQKAASAPEMSQVVRVHRTDEHGCTSLLPVVLFSSMEEAKNKRHDLNSGTYYAVGDCAEERLMVYKTAAEGIATIGYCTPVARAVTVAA